MNQIDSMKENRPFILVGPDGRTMHMTNEYRNLEQWNTIETENAVFLVAPAQCNQKQPSLLEQIAVYIDENISGKIILNDVAEYCGVSVSTVILHFRRTMGITFHQYLTRRRLAIAKYLIRSGLPLEEINKQVGYTDYSSFYRAFKQTYGISPRQYRNDCFVDTAPVSYVEAQT